MHFFQAKPCCATRKQKCFFDILFSKKLYKTRVFDALFPKSAAFKETSKKELRNGEE